jgi:hypothetical protein
MRRYIAFIHTLSAVLNYIRSELEKRGRIPMDPDDQFDDVHFYMWYLLNRIFDPKYGSEHVQFDILSLMVENQNDLFIMDQMFRKAILEELGKITKTLLIKPTDFMHQYITNGKDFSEVIVFVPTYAFESIPEGMEPLTQVGVSKMIDRYLEHFESTAAGKMMTDRTNSLVFDEKMKRKLMPRKFW